MIEYKFHLLSIFLKFIRLLQRMLLLYSHLLLLSTSFYLFGKVAIFNNTINYDSIILVFISLVKNHAEMWVFYNTRIILLNTHMNRLALYEDCIELSIPNSVIDLTTLNWVPYNPRKKIERYGCSITSLDGNDTGIPDLDSVLEYNFENATSYEEKDFCVATKHADPFRQFLNTFNVGRCHYLKLPPGGFFPWHRDVDPSTFRIIYTIDHCSPIDFVWLEDDKIIELQDQRWYYINTRKKHAVFSFQTAVFAVFNVFATEKNLQQLQNHFHIK